MGNRKQTGQSLAEYAIGLGCITALAMCSLGALGLMGSKIIHNMEHTLMPNAGHGTLSPHGQSMTNVSAKPWIID